MNSFVENISCNSKDTTWPTRHDYSLYLIWYVFPTLRQINRASQCQIFLWRIPVEFFSAQELCSAVIFVMPWSLVVLFAVGNCLLPEDTKLFTDPGYCRFKDRLVWLWHFLVNLNFIYTYIYLYIYIYISHNFSCKNRQNLN